MTLVSLSTGEDWLMRPVMEGLCRYESLKDGSLDLVDVALLNESIDVRDENQDRMHAALNKGQ